MKSRQESVTLKYKADTSELKKALKFAKQLEASLKRIAKLKLAIK